MKQKNKKFLIAGISGAIGGALGSVSGSNNWLVVAIVSAIFAILAAWALNGMIK